MGIENFALVSTLLFLLLSLVWRNSDWLNLILRLVWIVMTFWGGIHAWMYVHELASIAG